VVLPGPWETVSVTVEPTLALAPACGSWPITVPAGLPLVTFSGGATVKPSFWSTVRAVLSDWLVTLGTTRFSGRVSRYAATPPPASSRITSSAIQGHIRGSSGGGSRRSSSTT
jgi:hypothetical protein